MAERLSRRQFAVKAALAAGGLAMSTSLLADQAAATPPPPPVSDAEIDAVTAKLAKPLPTGARDILKADLASQKTDTANRLKVELPRGSEPCFRFVPTSKQPKPEVEG